MCLEVWDLIDQKRHLEGSRSNLWWAGSKSLPLMALGFLSQEVLVMASRGGTGWPMTFLESVNYPLHSLSFFSRGLCVPNTRW